MISPLRATGFSCQLSKRVCSSPLLRGPVAVMPILRPLNLNGQSELGLLRLARFTARAAVSYFQYRHAHLHGLEREDFLLWNSSDSQTDAVQLEYVAFGYNDVVKQKGTYEWALVEKKLNAIEGRKHQAVLRFHNDTMPGHPTTVPDYIKKLNGYKEKLAESEGKDTYFPDWSNAEYQRSSSSNSMRSLRRSMIATYALLSSKLASLASGCGLSTTFIRARSCQERPSPVWNFKRGS